MRFEKVSWKRYYEDSKKDELITPEMVYSLEDIAKGKINIQGAFNTLKEYSLDDIYDSIKLPERATRKSAGYDFYAPYDFTIAPGETLKIATGIRVILDDDKFLMCAPRSGHGFKARLQLDNTVGIIDADYSESDNEGHIHLKITNDSHTGKTVVVKKGEGMMQAIILPYFTVDNDTATSERNGGFGSTTK